MRLMKFTVAALAAILPLAASAAPSIKPGSPVSVAIEALNAPAPGGEAQMRVTAATRIDARKWTVRVQPPNGFQLTEGKTLWEGEAQAGRTIEFEFKGKLSAAENQIFRATTTIQDEGLQFGGTATYEVGGAKARSKAVPPAALRNGKPIAETPLRPVPAPAK